ncbi:hypothetical protein KC19_VG113000 [Ceratodon purpureus]|uniref:Uncharacterized protein n=1 Tax=Ceratodon purpureus TaxID=3225 RepID=A0A8T0HNY8_CERPU|nr:hypothetical protein KC19_VG113000 [Ceratodon purpureus]
MQFDQSAANVSTYRSSAFLNFQRGATPPYAVREAFRINALETTVQRMASDLSTSNQQILEVKELLPCLINPHLQQQPSAPSPNLESSLPPAACTPLAPTGTDVAAQRSSARNQHTSLPLQEPEIPEAHVTLTSTMRD